MERLNGNLKEDPERISAPRYLSKPIVPEELVRTIEAALAPQAAPVPSAAGSDAAKAVLDDGAIRAAGPPLDLDELLERCMGSQDFMAKMLDKFAHSIGADLERLEQAVSQGDLVAAAKVAHMLKGVGANLSAHGMREASLTLESACHAGRPDEAASAFAQLRDEVRRCLDYVPQAQAEALPR